MKMLKRVWNRTRKSLLLPRPIPFLYQNQCDFCIKILSHHLRKLRLLITQGIATYQTPQKSPSSDQESEGDFDFSRRFCSSFEVRLLVDGFCFAASCAFRVFECSSSAQRLLDGDEYLIMLKNRRSFLPHLPARHKKNHCTKTDRDIPNLIRSLSLGGQKASEYEYITCLKIKTFLITLMESRKFTLGYQKNFFHMSLYWKMAHIKAHLQCDSATDDILRIF